MNDKANRTNKDKDFADVIRRRYPLAAAVLDHQRVPYSGRYLRFVRSLESQRAVRKIPSAEVGS